MPQSRKLRPSSTPGSAKGKNCQRSELKNLMCKDTKLHIKDPKTWVMAAIEIGKLKGNYPYTERDEHIPS